MFAYGLSQYVMLPKSTGFAGVQALVIGRNLDEHIDRKPYAEYTLRFLNHLGTITEITIPEDRLKSAQPRAAKTKTKTKAKAPGKSRARKPR